MTQSFFKPRDIIIITGLIVIAIVVYIFLSRDNREDVPSVFAEILVTNTGYVHTISLEEDRIFNISEREDVYFEVRDGHIAFIKSPCPDQVCVGTGFVSRVGIMRFAACLPEGLILSIVDEDNSL